MILEAWNKLKGEVLPTPSTKENEFKPNNGVNNAHRKEYFNNFNSALLERIQEVKLKENK